ncbi:sodium:solute symporter [candidate division KSB1 bacterium]|nr:sodium:solute symporter [candidate division KSB1 bacterium]RQW04114.1 MAG: sodium:solute symporter [candidate division KSB1 bacterium]
MTAIDYVITITYLAAIVFIGVYMQRRAKAGIDSYFLGDRSLPWWALGASGMTSNMDVSGTMINTALLFALGVSGFFIEIRGGVTLIMAFLMIFMGKWNRRAQVMTLAEWMQFRFGKGREGDIARFIAAISSIIMVIAMITYFAIGSGKFIGEFLGIPDFFGLSSEFWAATLMIVLAMIYTVASGLYGVVWTDVFQGFLIFGTIIYVVVLAMSNHTPPETFQVSLPLKEGGYMAMSTSFKDWSSIIPKWQLTIPAESSYSIFNLLGIAIIFYLFKTTIEGSGGTGNYMLQRFLAAKSDRECGLLSLFWTFLLAFRWPFIAALAMMGVSIGVNSGQVIGDPEKVLPIVVSQLVPVGVKGLLIAGLMAAAMSTFDSTVNAGAAYWVKDIYQAFINPKASKKQLMAHSRWASVVIVIFGLFFSLFIKNINEIWGWITMSIGAGLMIPMLVRWYWWRLNGYGFAIGTAAGMIAAVIQKATFPWAPEYFQFLFVSLVSFLAMVIGTYATPATDKSVLIDFYKRTRPFGFWSTIKTVIPEHVRQQLNSENRRDRISTVLAVPFQLVLFLTTMTIVFKRWDNLLYLGTVLVLLAIGLYYFWFRHLSTEVKVDDD